MSYADKGTAGLSGRGAQGSHQNNPLIDAIRREVEKTDLPEFYRDASGFWRLKQERKRRQQS